MENATYSASNLIIYLSLSVGAQGASSYVLSIFGDGSYEYKNTGTNRFSNFEDQNNLEKDSGEKLKAKSINKIFDFARKINFKKICEENPIPPQVKNSTQSLSISIWNENNNYKDEVSFLNSKTPKEIIALRNTILELINEN